MNSGLYSLRENSLREGHGFSTRALPASHLHRTLRPPLLVSRITSYSIDRSLEATAYPSLKGTGPGPYMTQGHLGLA
jgi:hypothetical protein